MRKTLWTISDTKYGLLSMFIPPNVVGIDPSLFQTENSSKLNLLNYLSKVCQGESMSGVCPKQQELYISVKVSESQTAQNMPVEKYSCSALEVVIQSQNKQTPFFVPKKTYPIGSMYGIYANIYHHKRLKWQCLNLMSWSTEATPMFPSPSLGCPLDSYGQGHRVSL